MTLFNGLGEIRPTGPVYAAYYRGVWLGEYADEFTALRRLLRFANYITWRELS